MPVTGPESASTCRQAIVRRMNEVKNGAMTAISMRLRQRPARSAIAYASGYPISRQSSVASPAYRNDRRNCGAYSVSASE